MSKYSEKEIGREKREAYGDSDECVTRVGSLKGLRGVV